MEKMLTAEEIVASFECCRKNDLENTCAYCTGCPASNYYALDYEGDEECIGYVMRKAIDLIHRQKAEIERLTEELDLANETIDRNNKRYERVSIERQKALDRVDYLEDALLDKIRRNEELITAIKQAEQQSVKDTAKEILDEVSKHFGGKWLVELYKKYGLEWSVEVE